MFQEGRYPVDGWVLTLEPPAAKPCGCLRYVNVPGMPVSCEGLWDGEHWRGSGPGVCEGDLVSQPGSQHESSFQGRPWSMEGRGKLFLLRLAFNNSSVLSVSTVKKAHLHGHTFTQTLKCPTFLTEWTEVSFIHLYY